MTTQVNEFNLGDHQGYADAIDKLNELKSQLNDTEGQRLRAQTELDEERRGNPIEAAADKLLAGETLDVASDDVRLETLNSLHTKQRVLEAAIEKQRGSVSEESYAASSFICEEIAPQYQEAVKGIADAMVGLCDALSYEKSLRDSIRSAGASITFLRIHSYRDSVAEFDQYYGNVAIWMRRAVEHGHLQESDIPKEWRKAWFPS